MSTWAAFWIFMCVLMVCEAWIFTSGRDSIFFYHKTDAEKRLQERSHDNQ